MPSPKRKKTETKDLPQPPSFSSQNNASSLNQTAGSRILPSHLPPPSIFTERITTRPPFPEPTVKASTNNIEPIIIDDDLTTDILDEIREIGFSSFLENVPEERRPELSEDEVTSTRYLVAKDAYLDAGRKHLELEFYENAAMNFSCAILCVFLAKDAFEASHIIAEIASQLPTSIISTYAFQGVKLLLKANLLKNPSILEHAKNWLLKDSDHLYTEDKDIVLRAVRQSERNLGK